MGADRGANKMNIPVISLIRKHDLFYIFIDK